MASDCSELGGGLYMAEGRAWDSPLIKESAIDRFNAMAMDNPVYGHNSVLDTMSRFDTSGYYNLHDDDDELDQYVNTLFLDDVGEHSYDVDGDPYGEFKSQYSGAAPEVGESMYPEVAAQNAADFLAQFGKIFAGK